MSVFTRPCGAFFVAALLLAAPAVLAQATSVDVRVEGVTGSVRDNVRNALSVIRYRDLPELTETMVRRLHARADNEIRAALRPFGYYEPEVDADLQYVDGRWRARYRIRLGEPVTIRSFEFRVTGAGSDDPAFALPDPPPLRAGQRLHHPTYEELKTTLRTVAANRGYLDAFFTASEMRVSVRERAADIVLHLETGERYRFGEITLEQDVLRDEFVRRYVHFEEGEPFSVGALLALQFALTDSEYFSFVEVDARREEAFDLSVPVVVRMEERERHRYSAGVGYATDTGGRVLLGYENRRVNTRGHRWLNDIELAQIRQSFNTRYVMPRDNPVWDRFTIAIGGRQEEIGDVDFSSAELLLSETERRGTILQTTAARLSREREEIGASTELLTQLVPSVEWLYTTGDPAGFRQQPGWRVNLGLSGSAPFIGAPTEFVQLRTRARWITQVGERHRLILRAELGGTLAGEPERLPVSQRFFAGGDHSIRGYRFRSLGTRDADGNVVGGRYIATGTIEYEHWFTERWGVGTFVDAGNAFMGRGEGIYRGAGVGLRVGLPFVIIALDVAHPFDDERGRSMRLHLTLGGDP